MSLGVVTVYGTSAMYDRAGGEVNEGARQPHIDLDTENFEKYPHPEFPADEPALRPIDWSFLSARLKEARTAEEPAWLRALRARSSHMDLFLQASKKYNVPILLLPAIAEQESGNNPWALNIAGKGFMPKSKEEALRVLRDNYKESFDVGLMQVNSFWIRRFNLNIADAFEPAVNITLAAYILDECFHAYGADWKALGAYHHPPNRNTARSLNYAKVVWSRYLRLEKWKADFREKL
jgi:soluble lytic murein transglycosylase-like protein